MALADGDLESGDARRRGACDRRVRPAGPGTILSEHGFGPTRAYLLAYSGRRYPSKAILGVAHKFATSQPLSSGDFEGGKSGAAAMLRKLGFEIHDVQGPAGLD
jgi:hypothetical protein